MEISKSAPAFAHCEPDNMAHDIDIKQALNTFAFVVVDSD
jgi:hypothetical protein